MQLEHKRGNVYDHCCDFADYIVDSRQSLLHAFSAENSIYYWYSMLISV